MKSLAIIPARSGSKGYKDKNIAVINGRPMLDYTIKAAIKSNCFDAVMVSTDSEKYAKVAIECGAEVPFLRSPENSTDQAGSWDVVREVLQRYEDEGKQFDYVVLLQPTSPLRDDVDIRNAFVVLQQEEVRNVVSVAPVAHPVQWCFRLEKECSLEEYANSPYCQMRRQDLDVYYQENGAIYIVDAERIRDNQYNFYKDHCYAYIMSREHSLDIDSEMDMKILNAILSD